MDKSNCLPPHNSVGVEQSGKVAKVAKVAKVDKWTRSVNFHTTINIIKPKKHYFCEVTMNAMKNDPYPTKQTADSEAHRQSLPSWGDLEGYFGEQYIDQRTTGWDAMFTFSGKERDQETGYSYFGARYYDSDLSNWLSVDPLAHLYPSHSSYNYCMNNPIKLVDPDGRTVIVNGDAADEATKTQSSTNLDVTRCAKSGQLSANFKNGASYNTLDASEKQLYDAIHSTDVTVNLTANNENSFTASDGTNISTTYGGGFGGNTLGVGQNGKPHVTTEQFVSMDALGENYSSKSVGVAITHEITESYQGGLNAVASGNNATRAVKGINNPAYDQAHKAATPQPRYTVQAGLNYISNTATKFRGRPTVVTRNTFDKMVNNLKRTFP